MAIYLETLTNAGKKQINCNSAQSGKLSRGAGLARFRTNASNVSFCLAYIVPAFHSGGDTNLTQNYSHSSLRRCPVVFPHLGLPWHIMTNPLQSCNVVTIGPNLLFLFYLDLHSEAVWL